MAEKKYRNPTKLHDAICPCCGKQHRMNLFWSGRPPIRKYCENCKQNIDRNYIEEIVRYPVHLPRT